MTPAISQPISHTRGLLPRYSALIASDHVGQFTDRAESALFD